MIKLSGVYEILNTTNGHRYVGSAVNLKSRWVDHKKRLRGGAHENGHLQNAWNKYGEDTFEFDVLEYWEPEFLVGMEQWWMNMLQPEYNIAPVAGSRLGIPHTAKAKAKMSAANMGKKSRLGQSPTKETRAKLSAKSMGNTNCLGRKLTDETKARMSAANKGRKHSSESRANMSAGQKKRWAKETP